MQLGRHKQRRRRSSIAFLGQEHTLLRNAGSQLEDAALVTSEASRRGLAVFSLGQMRQSSSSPLSAAPARPPGGYERVETFFLRRGLQVQEHTVHSSSLCRPVPRARIRPWRSRGNRRFGLVLGPIQPTLDDSASVASARQTVVTVESSKRAWPLGRTADVRFFSSSSFLSIVGRALFQGSCRKTRPDDGIVSCKHKDILLLSLSLVRRNASGCAHSPVYRLPAARERQRSPSA